MSQPKFRVKLHGLVWALLCCGLAAFGAPHARAAVTVNLTAPSGTASLSNQTSYTLTATTSDDASVERVAFEGQAQDVTSNGNTLNILEDQTREAALTMLGVGNTATSSTTLNVSAAMGDDLVGLKIELIAPDNSCIVLKDTGTLSGNSFFGTVVVPIVKPISGVWRVAYSAVVGDFSVNSTTLQLNGPWTPIGSDFAPVADVWSVDAVVRDLGAGETNVRAVAHEINGGPSWNSGVGTLNVATPQVDVVSPLNNSDLLNNSEIIRATVNNTAALTQVRFALQPTLNLNERPGDFNVAIAQNSTTTSTDVFNSSTYANQTISIAPVVTLQINHPRLGDLSGAIVAPDGTRAPLFEVGSFGGNFIFNNFSVPQFIGKPFGGNYTIEITDSGTGATGTLNSWTLDFPLPITTLGFDADGPNAQNEYTFAWSNLPTRSGYYYVHAIAETMGGDTGKDYAYVEVPSVRLQGNITLAGGADYLEGGSVIISGDLNQTASIYSDGEWDATFNIEPGQNLTLRPQRYGYQFTPATRTITVSRNGDNNDELDFVATPENTIPTLTVSLPRANVTYRTLPQVLGTAFDAPAGVREVRVTLRRGSGSSLQYLVPPGALGNAGWEWRAFNFSQNDSFPAQTNDAWAHWSYALPVLADGSYQMFVSVEDHASNYTQIFRTVTIAPGGIEGSTLSLALSASTCSEAAGANAVTGTLTLAAPSASDTVVTLSSSDTTEATVPASITILAGQTTATFAISAVDDALFDGPQSVTISASNAQTGGANATLQVLDNDVAQPTPTPTALPTATPVPTATPLAFLLITSASVSSVTESENPIALTWRLSRRNGNLAQPLTVNLSSSDAETLQVPATATFAANENNIVVNVASRDDDVAGGDRTVTLTASATDVVTQQSSVSIAYTDPDRVALRLTSTQNFLTRDAPAVTLTISRIGTVAAIQSSALTVALNNPNPLVFTVPASVVIAAGSNRVSFEVRLNSTANGATSDSTLLTASAPGFAPVSLALSSALPLEFNGPKIPLSFATASTRTYFLNVPAGQSHLWVSLQARETYIPVEASLKRGGVTVATGNESSVLLHVTNPVAGQYVLEVRAQSSGAVMAWAGSNLPILSTTRTLNGTIYSSGGLDWLQLDVPSGVKRLDLALETVGNSSRFELFSINDLGRNLAISGYSSQSPLELSYPNPPPGRYIVRVYDAGRTGESGTEVRPYSVSARFTLASTPPRAAGIAPNKGSNTGDITTEIVGENLDPASVVKLVQGGRTVTANKVSSGGVSDGSRLIAGFALTGTTPGVYSVVVTSPGGRTFTLANAFTIVANGTPELWHELVARAKIRIGRDQTFTLHYGNRGTADAYGVPFMISGIPLNATVKAEFDSIPAPAGTETTPLSDAPSTVRRARDQVLALWVPYIPAGGEGAISFKINAATATPFTLTAVRLGGLFGEGTNNAKMAGAQCCGTPDGKNGAGVGEKLDYAQANCIGKVGKFVLNKFLGLALGSGCLEGGINLFTAAAQNYEQYARDQYFEAGGGEQQRRKDLFGNMMQMLPDISKTLISCAGSATPLGKAINIGNEILTLLNDIESAKALGEECGDAFAPSDATSSSVSPVNAYDPNDKIGPRGVGAQRYISGLDPMPYTIFFENKATASAPAEQVFITDQLDKSKYDLSTFSLGAITFADRSVTPPPGLKEWSTTVDMRPAKPIVVQISGSLNPTTGIVRWVFSSIDPETGLAPEDPDAAFLNPNRTSPEGEGSVSFVIAAKQNLPTLSRISNGARIIFDTNEPIDTPIWSNLTDALKPTSQVLALTAMQNAHRFLVKWSGRDVGAGVRNYSIYVSDNAGRSYRIWQRDTTATQAVYLGEAGKTYWFYSIARDGAGNEELPPRTPDARTTVASADLSVTMTAAPNALRTRAPITYTITAQNAGPQSASQVLVRQTLPVGATFTSATATIGRPTRSGNFVLLTVPTLARGAKVVLTTIVAAPQGARLEIVAAANGPTPDPNTSNNEVTLRTIVPPFVEWTTPANRATINAMPTLSGFAYNVPGVLTGTPSRVEVVITRNSDRKSWTGTAWGVRTPLATTLQVLAGRSSWTRSNNANSPLPNGTNLLEGLYTLEAKLFDRSGESSTSTIVVTVDKTSPTTITISRPIANAIVRSIAPIVGTAIDGARGSGITRVQIALQRVADRKFWNGAAWISATVAPTLDAEFGVPVNGTVTWARATSLPEGRNLLSGLYQITPTATDGAGNTKTGTPTRFSVDATVPTISITAPLNNSSAATLTRATGRTVDNAGGSGVLRVELFLQRQSDEKFWSGTRWGARTALPATLASGVWTRATGLPSGTNLIRGDYTLQSHAIDRAGNRAVAVSSFRVAPTTVAPRDVEAEPTTKAPRSGVALSSLGVRSGDSSVVLSFTASLDADVARDAAHYLVEINGEKAEIEAVELNGQTVTLVLGEGTVRSGDRVRVTWSDCWMLRAVCCRAAPGRLQRVENK